MQLAKHKGLLIGVVLTGAVLLAAVWKLWLHDLPLRDWYASVLVWLRGLGPVAFFTCMALLPVVGFPLIVFSLAAGPVFGPVLGVPTVLALMAVAIAINISISYWLARYAIRPLLERWVRRMGYEPPKVAPENQLGLAILARVTPGPPFFLQSYLLGLAEVRFPIYFWVSWGIAITYAAGLLFFGDALGHGEVKGVLLGLSLLVAVVIVVRFLRKRVSANSNPKS